MTFAFIRIVLIAKSSFLCLLFILFKQSSWSIIKYGTQMLSSVQSDKHSSLHNDLGYLRDWQSKPWTSLWGWKSCSGFRFVYWNSEVFTELQYLFLDLYKMLYVWGGYFKPFSLNSYADFFLTIVFSHVRKCSLFFLERGGKDRLHCELLLLDFEELKSVPNMTTKLLLQFKQVISHETYKGHRR